MQSSPLTLGLLWIVPCLMLPPGFSQSIGGENILIIVVDDVGVDRVGAYGHVNEAGTLVSGPTPYIDALARRGVLFQNVWANPYCSPTRATALTGRYGFRTGIGNYVFSLTSYNRPGLRDDNRFLVELMPQQYRNAIIGKWHLGDGGSLPLTSGPDHPIRCGFEYHAGSFANFIHGERYDLWTKLSSSIHDTRIEVTTKYATTDTTDEAIERILHYGDQPWFLWVAYNAPHKPLHAPPEHLHSQHLPPGDPEDNPPAYVKAMIEAMDSEIGRMLDAIPEDVLARTTIILFGDNGTNGDAIEPPFPSDHGKRTMYNGGVNVPFIVAGAAVSPEARGKECRALINTTDIFVTVAEMCGVGELATAGLDSVSFLPQLADPDLPGARSFIYAERFLPNFIPPAGPEDPQQHSYTIREERYKLIVLPDGTEEFFDVQSDYHEQSELLAQGLDSAQLKIYEHLKQLLLKL